MGHPALLFAGILLVKKAVGAYIYYAAKRYGWPRVYRRILEFNRQITPQNQQTYIQTNVKRIFYVPGQALEVLKTKEAYHFVMKYAEYMKSQGDLQSRAIAKMAEKFANAPSTWVAEVLESVEKDIDAEQKIGRANVPPPHFGGSSSRVSQAYSAASAAANSKPVPPAAEPLR